MANPIASVPALQTNGPPASGVDLRLWRTAENQLGTNLAKATAAIARLDERLLLHPHREALIARLAMLEVCDLSWADGSDIPIERLALYRVARSGGGQGDARGLLRADWAIRRLTHHDVDIDNRDALIAFLGLTINQSADDELMDLIDRALGPLFVHELDAWIEILRGGGDLHPLTRAAIGYQFWKFLELSRGTDMIEPAVVAARLGAAGCEALPFVPIATRNRRALQNLGLEPAQRLQAWLIRVTAACKAARREMIRINVWQGRAHEAISGMSGKTPARLVEALIAHPVVCVRMLAEEGDVSPASAGRALALFEEIELTKEVTGGERFRYWRCAHKHRIDDNLPRVQEIEQCTSISPPT